MSHILSVPRAIASDHNGVCTSGKFHWASGGERAPIPYRGVADGDRRILRDVFEVVPSLFRSSVGKMKFRDGGFAKHRTFLAHRLRSENRLGKRMLAAPSGKSISFLEASEPDWRVEMFWNNVR